MSASDRQPDVASRGPAAAVQRQPATAPGKRTLVDSIDAAGPVQAKGELGGDAGAAHQVAEQGTRGAATALPHGAAIQRAFGRHDVSQVQAFVGGPARDASAALGAEAYATGDRIAFGGEPTLHTAAHEAAHVVQQRGGVQLKGGVGQAGDPYERHADAVADRVVAGESAEGLLDAAPGGGATHAIQRQGGDDSAALASQAALKNTDVEIPAIEGALLTIRLEAVNRGLLSRASFDAGLALSRAMTQLSPAVAAHGQIDPALQASAATAAQQLYAALKAETADERNFKIVQQPGDMSGAVTSQNPYTGEMRVTTLLSTISASWLERLPEFIRAGNWTDAFRGYRQLSDGVDKWVADQLRKSGPGTADAAKGDAQQHYAQVRTALEGIADKHATRLPAVFHPDPATVAAEREAGRAASDAIPMNVYFWTEPGGKTHLYDVTAPAQPREQVVDGAPSSAAMATFFEEVARYPKGEVHFNLPGGAAGVAPTTGKIKWYEWIGFVALGVAAVGLALATAGASVPATLCFAAGAIAGGVSAGGHLLDSTRLGTATTASIVLDVAQIVASFASLGALTITVRAGSAAAAVANSRYFVPLVTTAAGADVVQLVALSDITFAEMDKIQKGAGSPEDKQRAMAVLITQLIVVGGLTALSVKGARDTASLTGKPLEIIEANGAPVLRVVGDTALPETEAQLAARDMRWQMELKNQKLQADGQAPRYPDLDAAVTQGMRDLGTASERGFPYGFQDKAAFERFGTMLKTGVAGKTAPAGGIAVPTEHAVVQGSAVYRPAADDVDVALLVTQQQFDQLIEQSFANQVRAVRARGIDPLRMTMTDAISAAEKTLANAVETGILKRDKVVPRLSDVRDQLQTLVGMKVDLSIVKIGGQFDHGPYFPIP